MLLSFPSGAAPKLNSPMQGIGQLSAAGEARPGALEYAIGLSRRAI
jgi:hypothetical protein